MFNTSLLLRGDEYRIYSLKLSTHHFFVLAEFFYFLLFFIFQELFLNLNDHPSFFHPKDFAVPLFF
jgi:hypothetical protein